MPISAIGAISAPTAASFNPAGSIGSLKDVSAIGGGAGSQASGNMFTDSLKAASQSQGEADGLMNQAASGKLTDLTAVMSSMAEAQLATQLTVALRNKAVESFNEIMRMQL